MPYVVRVKCRNCPEVVIHVNGFRGEIVDRVEHLLSMSEVQEIRITVEEQ